MKNITSILVLSITVFLFSCTRDKKGCTDPNALNYNAEAIEDNGKCEYPPVEKKSLLIFFGGTNCPTCGSFIYPVFKDVVSQSSALNVIPISAYSIATDPLFAGAAVNLTNIYEIQGLPDVAVGSSSNLLTKQAMLNAITAENLIPPAVSLGQEYQKNGNTVSIQLSGRFETDNSGQFFVVAYIIENGVKQNQSLPNGNDPNFVHDFVLRAATGTSGLGTEIAEGTVSKGYSFKKHFQVTIEPTWNASNIKVVSAIWKKDQQGFHFINADN